VTLWKFAIACLLLPFPWRLRRWALVRLFGYDIHPTAYVGRSLILARHVSMGEHSKIGDLNVIHHVARVSLGAHVIIGNLNWITARPVTDIDRKDIVHRSELVLADHAAITHRHLIECTDSIHIGEFSMVSGWRSQLLTRGLDLKASRQSAEPLVIGRYCLVGTGCILLKGTALPDCTVLAAGSVLAHVQTETHAIYSGVPAISVKPLDPELGYFTRDYGPVP
jgi:acetyltransferase-like isoleucine patch superfamily enzyme